MLIDITQAKNVYKATKTFAKKICSEFTKYCRSVRNYRSNNSLPLIWRIQANCLFESIWFFMLRLLNSKRTNPDLKRVVTPIKSVLSKMNKTEANMGSCFTSINQPNQSNTQPTNSTNFQKNNPCDGLFILVDMLTNKTSLVGEFYMNQDLKNKSTTNIKTRKTLDGSGKKQRENNHWSCIYSEYRIQRHGAPQTHCLCAVYRFYILYFSQFI